MNAIIKRLTNDEIIKAINDSEGNLTVAARRLHCSRQTIYNRSERSEAVRAAYFNAIETMVDLAESKLYENIKAGKESSIIFFLRTKGKYRGYTEQYVSWDITKLTDRQLERIMKGEDTYAVLRDPNKY
jgi:hypothetical protein